MQKSSFYTIRDILRCKNRGCPAGIENFARTTQNSGVDIRYHPHFSATGLKILFARIDRGTNRVVGFRI
jgi:hypothetical protein